MNRIAATLLVVAGLVTALAAAGCGSSDSKSSTPKYCDLRDTAATQLKAIKDTNVIREGTATLQTRIQTATGTLTDLADQASSDFPSETGAVKQSLAAVKTSIDQLGSQGTRSQALVALPDQLRSVTTDAQQLRTAVDGTCG